MDRASRGRYWPGHEMGQAACQSEGAGARVHLPHLLAFLAELCLRAGRQGATALELRAALGLSRLASSPDAHRLLGEVVGRFTEGHDTADLRAAQTQLSLIHPPTDD